MTNCFYCAKYGKCANKATNVCFEFVKDSDICDYCDKSVEVNHEVQHSESKQTLFVCDSCMDYMRMDTNQFWREVL